MCSSGIVVPDERPSEDEIDELSSSSDEAPLKVAIPTKAKGKAAAKSKAVPPPKKTVVRETRATAAAVRAPSIEPPVKETKILANKKKDADKGAGKVARQRGDASLQELGNEPLFSDYRLATLPPLEWNLAQPLHRLLQSSPFDPVSRSFRATSLFCYTDFLSLACLPLQQLLCSGQDCLQLPRARQLLCCLCLPQCFFVHLPS